jgi:hypothetical protein
MIMHGLANFKVIKLAKKGLKLDEKLLHIKKQEYCK